MAFEWVAAAAAAASGMAGIFFTWLTGHQSRRQAEHLAERAHASAASSARVHDRREAYLLAMRCVRLDLERLRYKEDGDREKLEKVDELWPKAERVRMAIEARIAVETFGTLKAGTAAQDLLDAMSDGNRVALEKAYERFVIVVRNDLEVSDAADSKGGTRP